MVTRPQVILCEIYILKRTYKCLLLLKHQCKIMKSHMQQCFIFCKLILLCIKLTQIRVRINLYNKGTIFLKLICASVWIDTLFSLVEGIVKLFQHLLGYNIQIDKDSLFFNIVYLEFFF